MYGGAFATRTIVTNAATDRSLSSFVTEDPTTPQRFNSCFVITLVTSIHFVKFRRNNDLKLKVKGQYYCNTSFEKLS